MFSTRSGSNGKTSFPEDTRNSNGHRPIRRWRDKKAEEAAEADRISLVLAADYMNTLLTPPGPEGPPNETFGRYVGVVKICGSSSCKTSLMKLYNSAGRRCTTIYCTQRPSS